MKMARDMAYLKHDATFGRKHALLSPEVVKVSGSYEQLGTGAPAVYTPPASSPFGSAASSVPTRSYLPGQIIIHKGESAVTVCEVMKGSALNEKLPDLLYKPGSTFGSAAIFRNKNCLADIVAGSEGATVAFYNLRELMKSNPARARELYDEAMEDLFHIVQHLEDHSAQLEKRVAQMVAATSAPRKAHAVKKPARKAVKKPVKKAGAKKPGKKPAKKAAKKPVKKPVKKPAKKTARKKR